MPETKKATQSSLSFEEAYCRLESILQQLNQGEISLERSIALYEEADALILSCNRQLTAAEQKIQKLVKNRNGELALDSSAKPIQEEFESKPENLLNRDLQEDYARPTS